LGGKGRHDCKIGDTARSNPQRLFILYRITAKQQQNMF